MPAKINSILFAILLFLNLSCYTVVDKTSLISDEARYPYKNREFIGKWIYFNEQLPDNYLRRVSKIELKINQSYYFFPDKNLESQYSIGEYEVKGDSMIFNRKSGFELVKYIYSVSSDTLKIRPIVKSDIQHWIKEKPPSPPINIR